MEDDIDALCRFADQLLVADVAPNELNAAAKGFKVRFVTRAEVIEHANEVAFTHQPFGDVAPDEACPAGYQINSSCHSSLV